MNIVTPHEIYHWLRSIGEHARNARLSRARLLELQQRKFRKLVAYAFNKSPYYAELMRRKHLDPVSCQPEDFPELTKAEVIERFDDLVTEPAITRRAIGDFLDRSTNPADLFAGRYHVLHSSGTSGMVAYYPYAKRDWIQSCSQAVRVSPLRLGKRMAFVAATRGHFAGISLLTAANRGFNRLFCKLQAHDVNVPLPAMVEALNRFQPHSLSGYGGVIRLLAEAQERGELRIRPVEVLNGGEALRTDDQTRIERVFGTRMKNVYASSECLYMAATLGDDRGFYLLEDELAFELAADHVCVTNLFNFTLPLIRYRLDDVLVPDETSHGLPFRRVKSVVGRREEDLILVNRFGREDFIHSMMFLEFVVEGLAAWQVVQRDRQSFQFRARLRPELSGDEREEVFTNIDRKVRALLAEKSMENVHFDVKEVTELPLDPKTGKFRMVVTSQTRNFVERRAA